MTETDLRYPVGKHELFAEATEERLAAALRDIAALPARMRAAAGDLDDARLDVPYRPEGWTVRQVVHHVADSHINAYTRLRLALTEDAPVIRPYDEKGWAELADAKELPIAPSLKILEGIHERWSHLLATLSPAQFARPLVHPDHGQFSIGQLTCLYGWHSRHHVGHITALRARMGWA